MRLAMLSWRPGLRTPPFARHDVCHRLAYIQPPPPSPLQVNIAQSDGVLENASWALEGNCWSALDHQEQWQLVRIVEVHQDIIRLQAHCNVNVTNPSTRSEGDGGSCGPDGRQGCIAVAVQAAAIRLSRSTIQSHGLTENAAHGKYGFA